MTEEQIESLLGDFRTWLRKLNSTDTTAQGQDAGETVNLSMLLAQFTALRHEVHLQTKATRSTLEQNAKLLDTLQSDPDDEPVDDRTRPLLKTLIDLYDSLSVAHQHVEKTIESFSTRQQASPDPAIRRSFWSRWFRARGAELNSALPVERSELHTNQLTAIGDGYALSLRRIDRILPQYGLTAIECVGETFDPEMMEVVELCDGEEPGVVVEEIRRGYQLNGRVFRYAQVKVGR